VKWWAHILGSVFIALALAPREVATVPVLVAIGAVLPDAVERMVGARHRSLHELSIYLILTGPLALAGFATLAIGAVDHILTDAMTIHGVTVFGYRLKGPFNTNVWLHNAASVLIHFTVTAFLV